MALDRATIAVAASFGEQASGGDRPRAEEPLQRAGD